ncbi:MAG: 2-phospho-L-lactate guanylyltransferase [Woeseiaceae bacterium]
MTEVGSPIWAVLPVKSLTAAKQRLAGVLSAAERRALMLHSTRDVLRALSRSSDVSGILLVSRDKTALQLGSEFGAQPVLTESDDGQSAAVESAVKLLAKRGVRRTLTIPGDTPLLTPQDVDAICRTLSAANPLTIVSNLDGTGTNCIAASPPDLIPYQFGENSFERHVSAARSAGIEPHVLRFPGLELDIDTQADLVALMAQAPNTETQRFLTESGIAERCGAVTTSQQQLPTHAGQAMSLRQ